MVGAADSTSLVIIGDEFVESDLHDRLIYAFASGLLAYCSPPALRLAVVLDA